MRQDGGTPRFERDVEMKNLVWIVVAGGIVLLGWWLFSGETPADVARDVSDQVNAPEVLAEAGEANGEAVVAVGETLSLSGENTAENEHAAEGFSGGTVPQDLQGNDAGADTARTDMPAEVHPVGGAGTTTLTDRSGTMDADAGGDSAAALGEAGGINSFAETGTTASVADSGVNMPEGAVSTMNGKPEDAPVIEPQTGEQTAADEPAAQTEQAESTAPEAQDDAVVEELEATRENDEIIVTDGEGNPPTPEGEPLEGTADAEAGASDDAGASATQDADTATEPSDAQAPESMDATAEENEAEEALIDTITSEEETADANAADETTTETEAEAGVNAEPTDGAEQAPAEAEGDATATTGTTTAEPESDITAAEETAPDAPDAAVPEQTVEANDSDAVTVAPAEDEALTVEGFDLVRAEELIDGSALSDEEKETLKAGLQDAQNTPELLEMMLEELRETLTEEEATPAVE